MVKTAQPCATPPTLGPHFTFQLMVHRAHSAPSAVCRQGERAKHGSEAPSPAKLWAVADDNVGGRQVEPKMLSGRRGEQTLTTPVWPDLEPPVPRRPSLTSPS